MNQRKSINLLRGRRASRTRAKIFGMAERPRVCFFRSNMYNYAQAIDDERGHTVVAASYRNADRAKDTKKTEQGKELGRLLAEQMLTLGLRRAVLDRRGYTYHGRIKAFAEGLREGGIQI